MTAHAWQAIQQTLRRNHMPLDRVDEGAEDSLVGGVEGDRQLSGPPFIRCEQQLHSLAGVVHAPAGVETRSYFESQICGADLGAIDL